MTGSKPIALILSTVLGFAGAWGPDGHAIVATIADSLLSASIDHIFHNDLKNTDLATMSDWCDSYDRTEEGKWSGELHYINYPGQACNFDWSRDCANDRCNVGAVTNFSKQIFDTGLSARQRWVALAFVIHLVGDLHQPLHVSSGDDKGGNDIKIAYDFEPHVHGTRSPGRDHADLHGLWDSNIVDQIISELEPKAAFGEKDHHWQLLSDDLVKRVRGEWSSNVAEWQKPMAAHRDEATLRAGLTTVALETAALSCSTAYVNTDGARIKSGDMLLFDYYLRAKPVVELQLAKAGVRLAQLLSDTLVAVEKERSEGVLVV